MLLAEALAARKDALAEVSDLRDRIAAAVVRYEDQSDPAEAPADLLGQLGGSLDRLESLTVRINRTNNETRLTFDGRDLSLMEAIAFRERLTLEAAARRAAVEAVEGAAGLRSGRKRWLVGRRTREELREIPTVDLRIERQAADKLSETVRRLDLALQQRNWTTDLI
jgi:hypothetical protein